MTPQLVGTFIPILGITVGLVAVIGSMWLKAQKMKLEMMRESGASSAVQDETARELQKLKDRVAVLERLLTDDDRKLAGEIERLRREDARG
jgi:hypothetical protein